MDVYIVEYGWFPDSVLVNTPVDAEYAAYWLATDEKKLRAMWVVEPVVDTPTVPIEDILPDDYETLTLEADVTKYGFIRQYLPFENIETVVQEVTTQLESFA